MSKDRNLQNFCDIFVQYFSLKFENYTAESVHLCSVIIASTGPGQQPIQYRIISWCVVLCVCLLHHKIGAIKSIRTNPFHIESWRGPVQDLVKEGNVSYSSDYWVNWVRECVELLINGQKRVFNYSNQTLIIFEYFPLSPWCLKLYHVTSSFQVLHLGVTFLCCQSSFPPSSVSARHYKDEDILCSAWQILILQTFMSSLQGELKLKVYP